MAGIAIVCGAGIISGKEIMARELGVGLREAGFEVHFLTSRWGSGEFGHQTKALGFPTHHLWLGFISATVRLDCVRMTLDQMRRWPWLLLGYHRFLKNEKPQKVIHTNWQHVLLLWPLLRSGRDIFWLHEVIPSTVRYRRLFTKLARRVTTFVAVSNAAAKSLIDAGVPADRIHVIPNGIADPAKSRPRCSNVKPQRIAIVGQIGAWKGHEDLVEALRMVVQTYPNTELQIFGKGSPDFEQQLRNRITDLDIDGNVIWHGFERDLAEVYRDVEVVVVPSRGAEPFGLTAIESGFFEIPVVASQSGGLIDIVEHGITGYLFEPGNIPELASYLIILLKDSVLRRTLGQNARERVVRLFGKDRFVQEFAAVLKSEDGSESKWTT